MMPEAHTPIAVGAGGPVRWDRFAADVAALAEATRAAGALANLWSDRYRFLVGAAAAMVNGQPTLLPSAPAPRALDAALEGAHQPLLLADGPLPGRRCLTALPPAGTPRDPAPLVAAMRASQAEFHVFTSGSTGHPVRHRKTGPMLTAGAEVTRAIFRLGGVAPDPVTVLATIPHQHMYGLEAAVFTALSVDCCLHRRRLFYPADLEAAVDDIRRAGLARAALVTSPAHLRYLEETLPRLPEIGLVLSATAPLGEATAQRIERLSGTPVYEIYGSTETGSLALRRTAEGELWSAHAGFTLDNRPEGCIASAPHLRDPVLLGDAVEIVPDGRFRLLGRVGDMINIAGKRSSVGALTALLAEAPGLADAAVVADRSGESDRLVLFAVRSAEGRARTEPEVRAAIRRHVLAHTDAVFVPHRVVFVERLARSDTGKITAEEQERLRCLIAE